MYSKRFDLGGGFYLPAVLAVITIVYLVSAIQLGPPMKDGNMTASFFPMTTAIIMLIALVCAMMHSVRYKISENNAKPDAKMEEAEAPQASKSYAGLSLGAIVVILLTAGYLLAFDLIGYFVSTFFYVLLLSCLFGGGVKKNGLLKLIATVVITSAGYLLFEIFFQVRLPTLWSQ